MDSYWQDWTTDPFIRGAYSYPNLSATSDTRKRVAEPVADQLYFAGEATNTNGHHATVHGAVESGYNAAVALIRAAIQ